MRKTQLLITLAASSLLCSVFLGWYPWQKSSLQANPPTNHLETKSLPAPTSSLDSEKLELTPEQIEKLSEQLANELAKPEPPRHKLCGSNSVSYLKLPLKEVDPVFRPCAADLLELTQVPLILPPIAPKTFEGEQLHAHFYTPFTKANRYYVGLTWRPGEYYQANRAWFEGEKITAQSPTLAAYYEEISSHARTSPFESHRLTTGSVVLSRGISGYYISGVCGANCHSAYGSVIWDQGGYRYGIGIKMGNKAEVLKIVNAAIENQQSNKLNAPKQN